MINKFVCSLCFLFLISSLPAQQIKVSYTPTSFMGVFSGKVILYLSKDSKSPKDLGAGIPNLCCFAINVTRIKPNKTILFDDNALSYPVKLSDIERGEYYVQAVWDRNTGGRNIGNCADNMYSDPIKINLSKNTGKTFSIVCNRVVSAPTFIQTDYLKELKAPSVLLSTFYKRPVTVDAAVILPKEYYLEPNRKFPVHYLVSGYGGDYHNFSGSEIKSMPIDTTPCITVFLDGNCPTGHSTYANSTNNGPWGRCLGK